MSVVYNEDRNFWHLDLDSSAIISLWGWLYQNCPSGSYNISYHSINCVRLSFKNEEHNIAFKLGWL